MLKPYSGPGRRHDDIAPVIDRVVDLYDSLETRYERLRLAYASLLEHREELVERVRTLHDMHMDTDISGTIQQANRAASVIAPAHKLLGTLLAGWVQTSQRPRLQKLLHKALKGDSDNSDESEFHLLRDATDPFGIPVVVRVWPVEVGNKAINLHWVLREVNPQTDDTPEYPKPQVELERLSECVFMVDATGVILAVNAAFTRVTGYFAEEAIGRNPRFLQSGLHDSSFYKDFWQELQSSGSWQGQIFNRRKSGEIFSEWLKVNSTRGSNGHVLSYTAVFYDLSRKATPEIQRELNTLPQTLQSEH